MQFNCKEISICDEPFGCTLTVSERKDNGAEQMEMSIEEVMNSSGKYILLQRTYPEDDFEKDDYYYETSDFEKSGELADFKIELSTKRFLMRSGNDLFEISIQPTNNEYNNLKKILRKLTRDKGELLITD